MHQGLAKFLGILIVRNFMESAARTHLERKYLPVPLEDSQPEPPALEGLPCPTPGGGSVLTTVTMSGRDPRTALGGPSTATAPAATHPEGTTPAEPRQDAPKPVPWVGKSPWRNEWLPSPVFLPGESHGQRSLAGYSMGPLRVRHN